MLNVRRGIDGCYWIPRQHPETEEWLDSQYIRLPGQLKWKNKLPNVMAFFRNAHEGKVAAIIGKGPSLDLLKGRFFTDYGCVIAINEAVHKMEELCLGLPLYVTQLDHALGETCRPKFLSTQLFYGPRCANLYEKGVTKLFADPACFGLPDNCISGVYAVMLARHMGCVKIDMYAFDGCLKLDHSYADSVGYSSTKGGSPLRFEQHRKLIEEAAKKIPLNWIQIKGDKRVITSSLI